MPPALVLLGAGRAPEVAALTATAGPVLASALALSLEAPLPPADPHGGLAALAERASSSGSGALVPLPLDPGEPLADGSTWAEALGAWRQPALLLITAEQQASGLAAAMVALARQEGVPLAGLIQWGLPWRPELRRRQGLPWLGVVEASRRGEADGALETPDLALALALACARLDLAP
ncbi:hypothetical protein ACLD7X_016230, partial [Aphanothece microscopica RSMan92]